MNNASMQTADRLTHLKIVAVALVASIAVIIVGISARTVPLDNAGKVQTAGPVIKAGQPVAVTRSENSAIR